MKNSAYAHGYGLGMAHDTVLGNAEENIIGRYTHGEITEQQAIAQLARCPGYTPEKARQAISSFTRR